MAPAPPQDYDERVRGVSHVGRVLGGKYELRRVLGEGGWGAVYDALQTDLGRRVAVKVLHTDLALSSEGIARFEREAKAAAALGHPNIVQVTDFQTNPGEPPFLVMEYLEGETLKSTLERTSRLPAQRVAFIAQQMLAALGAAHAAGIVHRDVKPDNVFLVAMSGVEDIVKILDFGVAKLKGEGAQLTGGGAILGSPAFMAPEQITSGAVDVRADLWAVGVCMYLALTGRVPFDAASLHALMRAITDVTPPPVSSSRHDLDPGLVAIVDRALHKDPAGRFASAAEMSRALEPYARPTTTHGGTVAMAARPMISAPPANAAPTLDNARPAIGVSHPPYAPTHSHAPPTHVSPGQAGFTGAPTPGPVGYSAAPVAHARSSASSTALVAVLVGVIVLLALGLGGAATAFVMSRDDARGPVAAAPSAAPVTPAPPARSPAPPPTGATTSADDPGDDPGSPVSPGGAAPATRPTGPRPAPSTAPTTPIAPAPATPPAAPRKQYAGATARFSGGEFPKPFTIPPCRAAIDAIMPLVNRCYAATEFEPPDHQFVYWTVSIAPSGQVTGTGPVGTAPRHPKLDVCVGAAFRTAQFPATDTGGQIRVGLTARTRDNP